MEPAVTASLISGGAQILGGVLGGGKKPDIAGQIAAQEASTMRMNQAQFDQKMQLAKQHGLHPLSVLGVPIQGFTPTLINDSGGGPDYGAIAQGASTIARGFVKPPEDPGPSLAEQSIQDANVRLAEAQAKRAEWDALRAQWTTEDLLRGQPGNPPGVRTSNDASVTQSLAAAQAGVSPEVFKGSGTELKQQVLPPHPVKMGHGLGTDQTWITGMDQKGKPFSALNPNLIQADFEDGATITALSKIYGPERAIEIMAVLEQAGPIAGIGAGIGALGKLAYDYFARQRKEAFERRTTRPSFSRRGPLRWRGPRGSD